MILKGIYSKDVTVTGEDVTLTGDKVTNTGEYVTVTGALGDSYRINSAVSVLSGNILG